MVDEDPVLHRDADGTVWVEWPDPLQPFYRMSVELLEKWVETINENARLRGLLHMHRVGTGHAAYADPLHGGWDGYEAACWDCEWRSGNVYTDDGGKERAQAEASAHRESFDAALSECASKDPSA